MEALEQLTLFTEASLNLAKTSASQASKRDCPVSAPASGLKCSELSTKSDPVMSLLKMCVERSISPSIPCTPVWSEKVTKSTLTSYQHLRLVRPTKGKDCSLSELGKMWPTPTVSDTYTGNLNSSQQKPGSMHSVTLPQAIHLWRTPDANCDRGASSAERMKWKQETGMPISLNDQVAHCGQVQSPVTEVAEE